MRLRACHRHARAGVVGLRVVEQARTTRTIQAPGQPLPHDRPARSGQPKTRPTGSLGEVQGGSTVCRNAAAALPSSRRPRFSGIVQASRTGSSGPGPRTIGTGDRSREGLRRREQKLLHRDRARGALRVDLLGAPVPRRDLSRPGESDTAADGDDDLRCEIHVGSLRTGGGSRSSKGTSSRCARRDRTGDRRGARREPHFGVRG